MPVPIGKFRSKKSAMAYWTDRLTKLPDGPLPPEDDEMVRSVLVNADWWVGDDFERAEFHMGPAHQDAKLRAMHYHLPGKPREYVSFPNAVRGKTANSRLSGCLRNEIAYQLEELRQSGYHLDHFYPLHALIADWLAEEGLTREEVAVADISPRKRGFGFNELADRELAARWHAYHLAHALVQYLSPAENLAKGGRLPYSH